MREEGCDYVKNNGRATVLRIENYRSEMFDGLSLQWLPASACKLPPA